MADALTAAAAWLAGPWQPAFMLPKIAAVAILAAVCGVVGPFLVLRRLAFFGDALSHAVLPGVALGYYAAGPNPGAMFGGALAAALVAAFGIHAIQRRDAVGEDSAIGIVFAAMFALGIALISRRNVRIDLSHVLVGQLVAVGREDVIRMAAVGAGVLLLVALFYKELVLTTFDRVLATTLRLPTDALDLLLLALLAVTIVVGLQTVGVVLSVALLVTPAATAYLVADRLPSMIAASVGVAALSGAAGLYLWYYAGIASSAAIVLPCTLIFGLVFAWTRWAERRGARRATSTSGLSRPAAAARP